MIGDDTITKFKAREVLDSRGQPTVEVEVFCQGGAWGRALVPSGASTGKHEALELRDGEPARFGGKGVRRAVKHVVGEIAPALLGLPASGQRDLDNRMIELDGTPNKARLGANAILGVSLACAHAAAAARGLPLWRYLEEWEMGSGIWPASPTTHPPLAPCHFQARMPMPMVNLISGGLHAGKNLDIQDFMFLPIGARSYSEALHLTVMVCRALSKVLQEHGYEGVLVGDEGGFGPKLASNQEALDLILTAFWRAGLEPGRDAAIVVDAASTHFYDPLAGTYQFQGQVLGAEEMIQIYQGWVAKYPILGIEDGLAEDDWQGWRLLTRALSPLQPGTVEAIPKGLQLIGDDLFVTHPERLRHGIQEQVANSILIKVNQIGTLTETLDVITLARSAGYRPVVSARSGETEDTTIADLAVGTGAGQIKIGSVARGERLAKYNQLLRIEEEMGEQTNFAAWQT